MRIGLLSDSHGDLYNAKKAISSMGSVDMLVHLGDYCRDAEALSKQLDREIIYVRGNCDFSSAAESDKIIDVSGKRLLLTHGHNYNVKGDYIDLYFKALESGVDAVLFGHTHMADVFEKNCILFINPGSVSRPRDGIKTYAVVTIDKGLIEPNIFQLL